MKRQRTYQYNKQPYAKRIKLVGEPVSERAAQIDQARELALLKKKVRKLTSQNEVKSRETSFSAAMVNGGGPLTDIAWLSNIGLSDIPQDTGENERLGDQITVKRIVVKGIVESRPENKNSTAFRVIVFRDKQHNNNSAIASAALYGSDVSLLQWQATGSSLPESMLRRHQNMHRYQVYRDVVLIANPQAISDYEPTTGNTSTFATVKVPFSFDIPIPDTKVNYGSNLGDNTAVNDNMFQLAIATVNQAGASTSYVSVSAQIHYVDN